MIAAMDTLQQTLCASVRAGVNFAALHLKAHGLIAELLHTSGCLKVSAETAVASGLSGVFFPHGLGHLLGLQVHDIGGLQVDPTGTERPALPVIRICASRARSSPATSSRSNRVCTSSIRCWQKLVADRTEIRSTGP